MYFIVDHTFDIHFMYEFIVNIGIFLLHFVVVRQLLFCTAARLLPLVRGNM